MRPPIACLSLLLALVPASLRADQPAPPDNVVHFQAQAAQDLPNDLMVAQLRVEMEGRDPAALADAANRAMRAALERVKRYPAVKARTGSYQTSPLRDKERIVGWRVSQELRLESADFEQAAALVGALQGSLRLTGMDFSVTPEARLAAEEALIAEAIAAFRERAELVRKSFGAAGYTLQEAHVSAGGLPSPMPRMARMSEAVAQPAVEAGESRITVTVQGAVRLAGKGR